MTPAMEQLEPDNRDHLDLLDQEATPLLAHRALRGHQVHQEEAMTGNLGHLGHQDLQVQPYLELTGAHRLSIFLDHRDHLGCPDYLDTHQG